MDESDWDSEPEELPPPKQTAVTKKPNGSVQHQQQGDVSGVEAPQEEQREGRRSKTRRAAAQASAGDAGAAPPAVSPRGSSSGHRQPKPRQSRQPEQRQKQAETREKQEEQPPFNFRPEAEDGQRVATRQKPRPPGRQQRSEYTVPADQPTVTVDDPGLPPATLLRDPGLTPATLLRDHGLLPATLLRDPGLAAVPVLSPSPRPRSAQTLPLLHTEESTAARAAASQDSFWRGHRGIGDPVPFLGRPIPPILPPIPPALGSDQDVSLKPLSSPGMVRHSSPAVDLPTSAVQERSSDGPLVPLDGPRSSSERSSPLEQETETAALAVVISSYQFSQPDLRVLRSGDQNPSQLLGRYGRLSHRQLTKMWSEVMWVASVPMLLVTTFCFALMRCLLESVVRPLTLGPLQLLGDHLLKPAAATVYDALLLPAATLLANAVSALALVGRPLGETLDALVRPLATLLASCRPVQVSYGAQQQQQQQRTNGAQQV